MQNHLKNPLTLRQLKSHTDEDGRLTIRVTISLGDLLDNDIEGINDLMDEIILDGETVLGSLADINYRVVGYVEGKTNEGCFAGSVIIEVNADVSEAISESEEV